MRGFFFHEEQAETVLREEGAALYHLQLLSEKTVTRLSACQECIRKDSRGSAKAPSVFAGWLCADAGTRASFAERACSRYAIQNRAGIEAESFASAAEEKEAEFHGAAAASFFGRGKRTETILATAVL